MDPTVVACTIVACIIVACIIVACIFVSVQAHSQKANSQKANSQKANSRSAFSNSGGLNAPCDGTWFEGCGDGLHCCWAQGCSAAHWTCQVNCDHNQLCGENPVGAACSSNNDCANGACGRAGAGAAPSCCASGSTDTYMFHDYCTQLPPGTPCWTDAMCGDGSAGMCSGTLGVTAGVCQTPAPWKQYCTDKYKNCVAAAQGATIGSSQGGQAEISGNVGQGAADLGSYYAMTSQCERQATVCQQNGGTWGPLTYTPAPAPPPPPPPPPPQPINWGRVSDGGDPTAVSGGINVASMF